MTTVAEPVSDIREYNTPDHLAAILPWSKGHLANQRSAGIGPRYLRVGGRVLYRREDILAYLNAGEVSTLDQLRVAA